MFNNGQVIGLSAFTARHLTDPSIPIPDPDKIIELEQCIMAGVQQGEMSIVIEAKEPLDRYDIEYLELNGFTVGEGLYSVKTGQPTYRIGW